MRPVSRSFLEVQRERERKDVLRSSRAVRGETAGPSGFFESHLTVSPTPPRAGEHLRKLSGKDFRALELTIRPHDTRAAFAR